METSSTNFMGQGAFEQSEEAKPPQYLPPAESRSSGMSSDIYPSDKTKGWRMASLTLVAANLLQEPNQAYADFLAAAAAESAA